jgi:hypothetical protein
VSLERETTRCGALADVPRSRVDGDPESTDISHAN